MATTVSTISELIDTLGGPTKAAEILGEGGPQYVVNWRRRGKISARSFIRHQAVLEGMGIAAPASFWSQSAPTEGRAA